MHANPPPSTAPASDLRGALRLALLFAALKLLIEFVGNLVAQHQGYGIFRDELYYIACGRHPAFGYLDQPPLVALQARLADALFGHDHLAFFRIFSALAGAAKLFLTGLLTWSLGGGRMAQVLAMVSVLCAGVYLGIDSYLSMNSFEPVFWMTCMLAVIEIAKAPAATSAARWWLLFGLSAGIGIENKHAEIFFLGALLLGILLSPQRRILFSRWVAAAITIIFLCGLPNLLWQIHYHFPTLQWLINVARSGKDVKLPPLRFLAGQIIFLGPLSLLVWGTGLVWLLRGRHAQRFRFIGLTYLIFLLGMMAMHAKDYYLAPIYPVLFAAGGCAWELANVSPRRRRIRAAAYCTVLVIGEACFLPLSIPVLAPPTFVAYTHRLGFSTSETENHEMGPLPQFYADRFGWSDLVQEVARIYNALSPADRASARIYATNYGRAGAVDVLGPAYGLPPAISGHQSYWFWGPDGYDGKLLIVIENTTPEHLQQFFTKCEVAGHTNHPLSMPYEHTPIFLCRDLKIPMPALWEEAKSWH